MTAATDIFYGQAADDAENGIDRIMATHRERHGLRTSPVLPGGAWHPKANPGGFRAWKLLGRYQTGDRVWMKNADGRWYWFASTQYRILEEVRRRIKAGEVMTTASIAAATKASRGYVSKILHRLDAWGFIVLTTIRGRAGGLLARLARSVREMFPPLVREGRTVQVVLPREGGNISDWRRRFDDGWGQFEAEMGWTSPW